MNGYQLIIAALLLLVGLLWYYNQHMHEEAQKWQQMVEEYCKRC